MRIIKPGKLGVGATEVARRQKEKKKRDEAPGKVRDIWDDYAPKKAKKRKEYERNKDGRLVQKKDDKEQENKGNEEELDSSNEPAYKPRTDFEVLEVAIGYDFKDRELVDRALTHRSVLGVQERSDYERLEFVGDAVLDLSVAHLLCKRHPDAREGDLSKMRAALVNTISLAEIAKVLEIGPFIKLGRGEISSGGAERPSILADVMEALIGAVYWDSSYETAMDIIERLFGDQLDTVTPSDPKTELQEELHAAGSEPPSYLVEMVEGPEHAPTFVTVVVVDGVVAGRGRGPTKKAAQQEAAAQALERLTPSISSVELAPGQQVIVPVALLVAELPVALMSEEGAQDSLDK